MKKCYICKNFNEKPRCDPTEIIEFIDNKTIKTNMEANSKIDKDESILLLKKTKNSRQFLIHNLNERSLSALRKLFNVKSSF